MHVEGILNALTLEYIKIVWDNYVEAQEHGTDFQDVDDVSALDDIICQNAITK